VKSCLSAFLIIVATASASPADGPGDNLVDKVRPVPPPGIAVPPNDAAELKNSLAQLGREIDSLRLQLQAKSDLLDLLPDVQIYFNAVHYALIYHEFFKPAEIAVARTLLKQGLERARLLREGQSPWNTATGLIARGYLSRIDGSVQPYGLVVPPSYRPGTPHRHRLDIWFHGRGETLSELNFIDGRQKSPGEFTPADAFVLHPYGRYCNANKLAGEVDLFEALAHVRKHYPVDDNRIAVRGFSMGGAACWQFAVHHAGLWAAAAPGAGFAETPEFLKIFQNETLAPTWYEQKLWHLYDCTDYAANLFNCPVVAYSGEIDKQKQAADIMAAALSHEGISLVHVIGPQTAHKYHPAAKEEINRRIDALVAVGRNPVPARVRFTTWTLRYHRLLWVAIDGLDAHWERAKLETRNVSALTLSMPPGLCPLDNTRKPRVVIDGLELAGAPVLSDRSWNSHFRKIANRWTVVPSPDDGSLRKRPGLQGPIDDAFMDSFLMVRPTRPHLNDQVGAWVTKEMTHAVDHWRRQFRGDARIKNDRDLTAADIAAHNLILWGDPGSNSVLAGVLDKLPIRWNADSLQLGDKTFPSAHHVPLLIYPNPLNPKRYLVLNSGFTFREYDYLNNARQVPKLPDFAVIDVRGPVTSRAPGQIAAAGFFGEHWQLPAPSANTGSR
jgi:hypothetical protein